MKVIRLKQGYRIAVSDSEMGMLRAIVADGIASWEGQEEHEYQSTWIPSEKAAYTSRVKQKDDNYGVLWTDEDRR